MHRIRPSVLTFSTAHIHTCTLLSSDYITVFRLAVAMMTSRTQNATFTAFNFTSLKTIALVTHEHTYTIVEDNQEQIKFALTHYNMHRLDSIGLNYHTYGIPQTAYNTVLLHDHTFIGIKQCSFWPFHLLHYVITMAERAWQRCEHTVYLGR